MSNSETERTHIAELLAFPLTCASNIRLLAHELWSDGEGGWTSNDRFEICNVSFDANPDVDRTSERDQVIDAVLA